MLQIITINKKCYLDLVNNNDQVAIRAFLQSNKMLALPHNDIDCGALDAFIATICLLDAHKKGFPVMEAFRKQLLSEETRLGLGEITVSCLYALLQTNYKSKLLDKHVLKYRLILETCDKIGSDPHDELYAQIGASVPVAETLIWGRSIITDKMLNQYRVGYLREKLFQISMICGC